MRIRDYVNVHGVDQFSLDDFFYVGSKISKDPARLILVGGQAVEAWGHYFGVMAPSGDYQPLTEDIDWYGTKEDAKWLCKQLERETYEINYADDFDPSPNSATAFHRRPDGRVVLMDFLKSLIGIETNEIREKAVEVQVGSVTLQIMHPFLCLRSRLANLEKLPNKRTGNGIMQAVWAVNIISAFLRQTASKPDSSRPLMKACIQVMDEAEFKSGPFCFHEFNVDPLTAITDDILAAIGGRFVTEEWPRRVARIEKKRRTRAARIYLTQQASYKFSLGNGSAPAHLLVTSMSTPLSSPSVRDNENGPESTGEY